MKRAVSLPLPPSTNNLYVTRGRFRVPSKAYQDWTAAAVAILSGLRKPEIPARFHFELRGKINRARDGDNLIKGLLDACVKAGVIPDDNLLNIIGWHGEYKPDKGDPYVLVWFEEA